MIISYFHEYRLSSIEDVYISRSIPERYPAVVINIPLAGYKGRNGPTAIGRRGTATAPFWRGIRMKEDWLGFVPLSHLPHWLSREKILLSTDFTCRICGTYTEPTAAQCFQEVILWRNEYTWCCLISFSGRELVLYKKVHF